MVEFNSVVLIGMIIVLSVWGTTVYHRRRQEYKNEIIRLDQLISSVVDEQIKERGEIDRRIDNEVSNLNSHIIDVSENFAKDRDTIHTRIDTEILEVNRRIDESRQELIRENASILKTVKSR